jgi:molecular chaperone GrpE
MSTTKRTTIKQNHSGKKTSSIEAKLKTYGQELKKLKSELKENNDKLLRAYADLQNLQKRMEKELSCKEEEIKKKYLIELIDLTELLKQAYKDTNPKQGLKAILNNLHAFMEKEQITPIECVGKEFDHTCHHALSTVEKDDCEDGIIVDEIKKGYHLGDKLLRPAQVIVAKKKENNNMEGT